MIPFATVVRVAKATALVVGMAIGVIALGLAGPGSPAKADWYSFSYDNGLVGTGTSIVFTGELSGTVTSGTLAVTGFRDLVYNGIALSGTDEAAGNLFGSGFVLPFSGGAPFVTFSGSAMDVLLLDGNGTDLFGFFDWQSSLVFSNSLTTVTPPLSPDLNGDVQPFNAAGWTLTPVAVPEPSQVVLLASAGVVFGGWRLRRFRRGRPVGDDTMADG
jgi:hypothetical protein